MNLKEFLTAKQITPAAFANLLGISRASIYGYIAGRIPREDIMQKIVEASNNLIEFKDLGYEVTVKVTRSKPNRSNK